MKFTELLREIQSAYPEQPRVFHVIATRYYLGAESLETLKACALRRPVSGDFSLPPLLSAQAVQAIIDNR